MKRFSKQVMAAVAAATVMLLLATGCARTPLSGVLYTDIRDGLTVAGNAGSSKVGTAEAKSYLGLVALGDASIQTAARSAGITRIHHVDYKTKSYLGLYTIYTVIVYGE